MPGKVLSLLAITAFVQLQMATAQAIETIPTEVFFKNPEFINVQLSPDARKLGVLTKQDGEGYNLVVFNFETGQVHQITSVEDTNVYWYGWITGDRLVFYYGESTPRISGYYVAGLDGKKAKRLGRDDWFWTAKELGLEDTEDAFYSRRDGNRGQIGRCRPEKGAMDPDKQLSKLWRSVSGRTRIRSYLLDHRCQLRAATTTVNNPEEVRRQLLFRESANDDWRILQDRGLDDAGIVPLAFDYDDQHMFVASDLGRATKAVYRFDPASNQLGEMIYGDDVYDVSYVLLSHTEQQLLGVGFAGEAVRVVWLEPNRIRLGEALGEALPEYGHYFQFSSDGMNALVETTSDRDPGAYWLFDSRNGTLKEVLRPAEWIKPELMARVEPIEFKARDEMVIRGYLTRPVNADDGPLPMIVYPHGGPHGVRDVGSFDPSVQFFANRGYAVLQIDFRGSGGYGLEFFKAGLREYGEAIQDDITDGVHWALEQGFADPDRICIYGGSFGGYAALMGVVLDPDLYKCAVSFAGVSDLRRMGRPDSKWFARQVGDFWDDVDKLHRNSPVYRAEDITAPVMLIHGRLDDVVSWTQTQLMVDALEEHGKTFDVIYFEDEGHGLYHEENRVEAHEAIVAFIGKYISPSSIDPGSPRQVASSKQSADTSDQP